MKKLLSLMLAGTMIIGQTSICSMAAEDDPIRVGLVMNQATTQVISVMGNHMVEKCEEMGVEATLVYYDMDVATMISQIEDFTNSGYDGIAVLPMNSNDGAEAMQAAKDAGLKVVTFDTIPNCDYDYSFTASNTELGYKIGEAAAEWAQENLVAKGIKPVIGVINQPQSEFLTERANGTLAALEELLPEGEVVISAAGDTEPAGLEAAENFLVAYPDVNVICTINDDTGSGVYNAFSAAGYGEAEDRGLFTCDGTLTGLENVAKGGFHKTCIDLSLPTVGEWMMEALVASIKGEECEYEKDTHFPMNAVTAENAAPAIEAFAG